MPDTFDSIAVIPNATDNFDEVWGVITRENGRNIERFAHRTRPILCEGDNQFFIQHQIRLDSSVTYDTRLDVSGVTLGTSTTLNVASHGLSDGDLILLDCIDGSVSLNATTYKATQIETDYFKITDTDDNEIDSSADGS